MTQHKNCVLVCLGTAPFHLFAKRARRDRLSVKTINCNKRAKIRKLSELFKIDKKRLARLIHTKSNNISGTGKSILLRTLHKSPATIRQFYLLLCLDIQRSFLFNKGAARMHKNNNICITILKKFLHNIFNRDLLRF